MANRWKQFACDDFVEAASIAVSISLSEVLEMAIVSVTTSSSSSGWNFTLIHESST